MKPAVDRREFRDWVSVPVRWSDMDAYHHVNNAKYVTYLEIGRIQVFRSLAPDGDWLHAAEGPVLASVTCNFRRPVQHPATIEVGTRVGKISRRSFHFEHGLFLDGTDTLVADARSIVVWINRATGEPVEISPALREALERLM
ncbi:MAG TPA: thioesterase family protein [Candidatus Hydrogenedentes bacterium]|nr:thioesterase family protein [Candidatus Hydrogenedentota bacterium]HNT87912.1 thioesterase family protein [Candidatus Hydrogenedentota bacterium]